MMYSFFCGQFRLQKISGGRGGGGGRERPAPPPSLILQKHIIVFLQLMLR